MVKKKVVKDRNLPVYDNAYFFVAEKIQENMRLIAEYTLKEFGSFDIKPFFMFCKLDEGNNPLDGVIDDAEFTDVLRKMDKYGSFYNGVLNGISSQIKETFQFNQKTIIKWLVRTKDIEVSTFTVLPMVEFIELFKLHEHSTISLERFIIDFSKRYRDEFVSEEIEVKCLSGHYLSSAEVRNYMHMNEHLFFETNKKFLNGFPFYYFSDEMKAYIYAKKNRISINAALKSFPSIDIEYYAFDKEKKIRKFIKELMTDLERDTLLTQKSLYKWFYAVYNKEEVGNDIVVQHSAQELISLVYDLQPKSP